jgi:hypothetical protein
MVTTMDKESPESIDDIWASAAQMATVGIFVILLGICLYVGRPTVCHPSSPYFRRMRVDCRAESA